MEFQNRYILNKHLVLTAGYDYRKDQVESTDLDKQVRNTHSLYAQAEVDYRLQRLPFFNKVKLIPALRYDDYSDIGSQASPKAGISLSRSGDNLAAIRANIGKSFRSPTFNDLYWPDDFWSVGNPNLKPETGLNYDAGTIIQYDLGGVVTEFEMTYFVNNLKDLIIWAPMNDGKWTPMNVDKSETKGLESRLSLGLWSNRLNWTMAHTFMEAKNVSENSADNGKYLIYRPRHKFDWSVGFNYSIFKVNLNYSYVDKSFINSDNSKFLPAFRVFDFTASAMPSLLGVKVFTKLDVLNVLDKFYFVMNDSPMPGRQIRFTVGLRY